MWRANGDLESYLYVPLLENKDAFCSQCFSGAHNTNTSSDSNDYNNNYDNTNSQDANDDSKKAKCQDFSVYYCSLHRGRLRLKTGTWYNVRQYVKLNEVGKSNGVYKLEINNETVSEVNNL
eukprot:Awhi_evm1s14681